MRLAERSQPSLNQWCVGQNPAVEGGVVHLDTALQEQLLDVAVAERVAQVPGARLHDQSRLKVPALEVVLGPALQLGGDSVEDHGPPPGWRRQTRPVWLTSREPHKL